MLAFIKRVLFGQKGELKFSYDEKRYSFGVIVLIVLLTSVTISLGERALADLRSGIPHISYPSYYDLPEHVALRDFNQRVLSPLHSQQGKLKREQRNLRSEYDSSLLEKIAGEENSLYGGQVNVAERFKEIQSELAQLSIEIAEHQKKLKKLQLAAKIAQGPLEAEYRSRVRWRQLKVFLWEAIFWLPFFFFSLWWYSRTKRTNSRWEIVALSSLIAGSIFTFQSFSIFLWSWIPREFLEWLWEILQATLLTRVVGYYLMMGLVILLLGGLTVYVHRKATDPVSGGKKKIRNGQCPQCSYPLNLSAAHCGGCGRSLQKKCTSCKKEGYSWQTVCVHCGAGSKKDL